MMNCGFLQVDSISMTVLSFSDKHIETCYKSSTSLTLPGPNFPKVIENSYQNTKMYTLMPLQGITLFSG